MYILMARYSDEPFIQVYQNKDELLERLADFDPIIPIENYCDELENNDIDFDKFPSNTAYLIKGKLVVPKVIETVTRIEVE